MKKVDTVHNRMTGLGPLFGGQELKVYPHNPGLRTEGKINERKGVSLQTSS